MGIFNKFSLENMYINFTSRIRMSTIVVACLTAAPAIAEVSFEKQIKISDKGLFFDGAQVSKTAGNRSKYDYVFGNRITPHGDCIKIYKGYVFMTWYRGGENDRHVMLSRYNPNTGVTKTIEFPHRHTGFQNKPHLGESHNTIAIGIAPTDGTIHMLYDMHAYSEKRPANGSLSNDYFRYSYSNKNAATVPDSQFNLNLFVKGPRGNYKHLHMKPGVNYKALTYPNFFTNDRGELFMWIREGGDSNGAYKFAKYDGNSWSNFTHFNMLNARKRGHFENWGLYGDMKFESGKIRMGFHIRTPDKKDKYTLNNGFYYGSSDDPTGRGGWKTHKGDRFSLPVINPSRLKVSEPADLVKSNSPNSARITRGADWTVTDRGDIHFVTQVSGGGKKYNVHTYKKSNQNNFTTKASFPGGNLYSYGNDVYLIGLQNGRVFIEKATGGTNSWKRIYSAPNSGKRFRHGNAYIDNGKAYFYLMEKKSGSAQPIYLQIIDLGLKDGGFTPTPVRTPAPAPAPAPTGPTTLSDSSCLAAGRTRQTATAQFSRNCSSFSQKDCDRMNVTGQQWWVCSSEQMDGGKIPTVENAKLTIQAENYQRALDKSAGNRTGLYRDGDVDIVALDDTGSDYGVGHTSNGESLVYDFLNLQEGNYSLHLRLSSNKGTGLLSVDIDGDNRTGAQAVNYSGGWQNYQTMQLDIGNLAPGSHSLSVNIENAPFNINWLQLVRDGGPASTSRSVPTTNPSPRAQPTASPAPGNCIRYRPNTRQEIRLPGGGCIKFPYNLASKTLQVWDSDTNTACNFRGTLASLDGSGRANVSSNYVSIDSLSGSTLRVAPSNGCAFLKIRAF